MRGSRPQGPGTPTLGGPEVPPRRWSVRKEGHWGAAFSKARAHQPWGDGESCPGGGRCSRWVCEGQQFPGPGHTSLSGRGVLLRWWSVLKEGPREAAVPKARAHQPEGKASSAQAVVGADEGPVGGSNRQGPAPRPWGDGLS